MPRKPNYRFERSERDRQKAAKKAARLAAKQGKTDEETAVAEPNPDAAPPEPPTEE